MEINETNSRKQILLVAVFVVIYASVFTNALIPDYIQVCRSADPQLEKCINNSIESIRSKLVKGIPELDVPPLEPLILNEVSLSRGPDGAKIEASVKNIKVHGPSNFIINALQLTPRKKVYIMNMLLRLVANCCRSNNVPNTVKVVAICGIATETVGKISNCYTDPSADVKNSQFDFKILLPSLRFKGDYAMNMRILLLTLQGKGVITGNLTNYKADVKMKGDKVERNGKKYLHMRKMKTKLDVGDVSIHLSNLFNGDPILGPATNRLLNSNSKIFLEEIQPALESSISEVFTDIANRITLKFTYDELFP